MSCSLWLKTRKMNIYYSPQYSINLYGFLVAAGFVFIKVVQGISVTESIFEKRTIIFYSIMHLYFLIIYLYITNLLRKWWETLKII